MMPSARGWPVAWAGTLIICVLPCVVSSLVIMLVACGHFGSSLSDQDHERGVIFFPASGRLEPKDRQEAEPGTCHPLRVPENSTHCGRCSGQLSAWRHDAACLR